MTDGKFVGTKTFTFNYSNTDFSNNTTKLIDIHETLKNKEIKGISMRDHNATRAMNIDGKLLLTRGVFFKFCDQHGNGININLPFENIVQICKIQRLYPLDSCVRFNQSNIVLSSNTDTNTEFAIELTVHYK